MSVAKMKKMLEKCQDDYQIVLTELTTEKSGTVTIVDKPIFGVHLCNKERKLKLVADKSLLTALKEIVQQNKIE